MLHRVLNLVHLDFAPRHRSPSGVRVALATVVSVVGSPAADALMHLAIALVTYNALVRLAPVRAPLPEPSRRAHPVRP
jgi:hypothetical protein